MPVEHLPAARRGGVHQHQVGVVAVGPGQVVRIGPEGLDHPPDAVPRTLLHHLENLLGSLRAMELHRPNTGTVRDREHPGRQLIAEHTDGEHIGGQTPGDVVDVTRRHLARRRGEDEADRVGPHRDGEEGILLIRDPADLDEHRG